MSKQDLMVELVKAGKSTREEIVAALECTTGSLASYLTGLRTAAKYSLEALSPVEVDEDGRKVFKFVTHAEAQEMKAAKTPTARVSAKSPEERLEAATKRAAKTVLAAEAAAKRLDGDKKSQILKLRSKLADINSQIAEYELAQIEVPADDLV